MSEKLLRVGTTYLPVQDVEVSAEWYVTHLGAELNYKDHDKAILNLANQSFFLVKAQENQTANFIDAYQRKQFSVTFEVNGERALQELHEEFKNRDIKIGPIEDRGHAGRNFVFEDVDGNLFDVWSELSPQFKKAFHI